MNDHQPEDVHGSAVRLVPGNNETVAYMDAKPTDKERAEQLRGQLRPLLEQACDLITGARREGLVITFGLGPDQYGIQRVTSLDILRPL